MNLLTPPRPAALWTRRSANILFLLLLGVAATSPLRKQVAHGVVFEDLDQDGVRDSGEPGLAGVRVSDGRTVVLTDAEGRWSLPVEEEAVVFLTKPSGFRTPLTQNMLPRFYYLHRPSGSPRGMRYPGIEPTGPLPASIDFPLIRSEEPSVFEALLFADPQPANEAELDYVREDVVNDLIGTDAAFGMTLGDILFDDLSLFPRYIRMLGRIGIPWYNVPGNHDMNFEAEDDRHALETFQAHFGPPYYSFEMGDALFIVLDNIAYRGTGASDPEDASGNGGYDARIGRRQIRWLAEELRHVPEEQLIVLAMHAPLLTAGGYGTEDLTELLALLAGRPNLYAVAGHTHTTEHVYLGEEEGFAGPGAFHHHVLATVSGSWWSGPFDERGVPTSVQRDGTPNGYHVLEVDGARASVRFRAAGKPADHQMRIAFELDGADAVAAEGRHGELLDGRLALAEVSRTRLVVNLFDGGPRSKVTFRIGEGAPIELERIARKDPHVEELYRRHEKTKKSWVEAVVSTHLFQAPLPKQLAVGTHSLHVRAQDEFGRVHHAHCALEVVGD